MLQSDVDGSTHGPRREATILLRPNERAELEGSEINNKFRDERSLAQESRSVVARCIFRREGKRRSSFFIIFFFSSDSSSVEESLGELVGQSVPGDMDLDAD